jgi:hypothetical protein
VARSRITSAARVLRGAALVLALTLAGVVQGAQTGNNFNVEVTLETQHKVDPNPRGHG